MTSWTTTKINWLMSTLVAEDDANWWCWDACDCKCLVSIEKTNTERRQSAIQETRCELARKGDSQVLFARGLVMAKTFWFEPTTSAFTSIPETKTSKEIKVYIYSPFRSEHFSCYPWISLYKQWLKSKLLYNSFAQKVSKSSCFTYTQNPNFWQTQKSYLNIRKSLSLWQKQSVFRY